MPSIEENLAVWDGRYQWPAGGDEWSSPWGGPRAQWYGCLLPRLHGFLPAGSVLEIAPGHGRWTQFLKDNCERLTLVDLSAACIEVCKTRFAANPHIAYHVNDGVSLEMVPDGSIDFVFSFDSLVHTELEVLRGYLLQIARKLTPNGVGFIHHSNLGQYRKKIRRERRIRGLLNRRFIQTLEPFLNTKLDHLHWRSPDVSAAAFREACAKAGLACVSQELINWHDTPYLIDCLSTFRRLDSRYARDCVLVENPNFTDEAKRVAKLASLYACAPEEVFKVP